ncbi:hypothetical protein OAS19_06385 [Altererythrobacter sp.]|nr:hypothetical protein [Altererythrobacter sp.]
MIASIILESGEDMSTDERTGIIAGMTYFIGRWEAMRGGSLNAAMVEQFQQMDMANFPVLAKTCGDRVEAMGARMTSAGAALEALGEADSAPIEKEGTPATADSEGR